MVIPCSINDGVARYYGNNAFHGLAEATQRVDCAVLERFARIFAKYL